MSAAHLRSGSSASNRRASTLGATGRSCALSVVRGTYFLLALARIPLSRITFATMFSHTASPPARNAAHTRGLPYTPRFSRCTALTCSASSSRRVARALSGRSRQA
jgi:hypothetical protein